MELADKQQQGSSLDLMESAACKSMDSAKVNISFYVMTKLFVVQKALVCIQKLHSRLDI